MIVYYHSADLDGICSGAICRLKYPDAKFIGYDYGEPIDMIPDEDIIMVDVSLPMDQMEKYASISKSFIWIDHHVSAIKEYTKLVAEKGDIGIRAVLKVGLAACELTWDYFFGAPIPKVIKLLGRYDVWDQSDPVLWKNEILPFQYWARSEFPDLNAFYFPTLPVVDIIMKNGASILRYQAAQDERNATKAFPVTLDNLKGIALNTSRFNSMEFESVWNEENYDFMMAFQYTGIDWKVSLYTTKDDVDCSKMAKERGGGGHRKAAGYRTKSLPFLDWQ